MTTHELKCWPDYFAAIWEGRKRFELRKDDRSFAVGDALNLREWDPETQEYSGRRIVANVTYKLHSFDGLNADHCIMSIDVTCLSKRDICNKLIPIGPNVRGMWVCHLDPGHIGPCSKDGPSNDPR